MKNIKHNGRRTILWDNYQELDDLFEDMKDQCWNCLNTMAQTKINDTLTDLHTALSNIDSQLHSFELSVKQHLPLYKNLIKLIDKTNQFGKQTYNHYRSIQNYPMLDQHTYGKCKLGNTTYLSYQEGYLYQLYNEGANSHLFCKTHNCNKLLGHTDNCTGTNEHTT